jgi:NADH:ubiquinone oxidoreductase subunit E
MDALRLASLLEELPTERTSLLDNLGRIRREVGPITAELSDTLADHMNIRRGDVHEVVSFYSFLTVPLDAVRVCTGPVCDCLGARDLLARAEELAPDGLPVVEVPCLGHCDLAPVGTRGDTVLPHLDGAVIEAAIAGGPVDAVTWSTNDGSSLELATADATLSDYEARGGLDVLRALPPRERIVEELKASELVGYGGAGFPTGSKWEAVARTEAPRFVISSTPTRASPGRSRTATSWSCGRICCSRRR